VKVKDAGEVKPVQLVKAPEPSRRVSSADRVSLGEAAQVKELIAGTRSAAARDRAEHVAKLERAVRQGTYQPDPQRLAEEIVSAAEIDARLRAMLKH
jgi:negative regulator of flagellin synthesis FlgM